MARQIVALCTVLALLAVPSHEQGSQSSTLTSPCPNVFLYDPPGSEPGLWSGVVTLTTDNLLYSTWLNIVLDSHATKLMNWLGNVTTQDGLDFVIDNDEMQIHPGQPVLVPFFIQYDPLNTIPGLRAIRLNGKTICNAVTPQRGTVGRPVVTGPEIRTNLDMKQMRIPPSKPNNPVYRRPPVNNNSSAAPAFNIDNRRNTPITTDDCGLVAGGNQRLLLINNGMSYERGGIPWLVAIYRTVGINLNFICGGTLVSDRHVVTAAHCMRRSTITTPIAEFLVKVGVHRLNDWSDDFTVTRTVIDAKIYEEYDPKTIQNDILIFVLDKRVTFNRFIRPACLWSGDTDLSRVVGDAGVVAGWGDRDELNTDIYRLDEPQMARMPIVSTNQCRASNAAFHIITNNNTLCAGDRNGVGPCTGDSGVGLYLLEDGKWRLRGIVSVSLQNSESPTCNLNDYVVFTDTAQFLPWIRRILSVKYYD